MKKVFLFPLVFFFAACNPEGKPVFLDKPDKSTKETLSTYEKIVDYRQDWTRAQADVVFWLEIPGVSEHKTALGNFLKNDYPRMKVELKTIAGIPEFKKEDADKMIIEMDELALVYKNVVDALPDVAAYNDPAVLLPAQSLVLDADSECAVRFKKIDDDLNNLKEKLESSLNEQIR